MTTVDAAGGTAQSGAAAEAPAEPAPVGLLAGNPALLGLPAFLSGSVALGLTLVGAQVPAGSYGAALAIILASTSLGLIVATIWAIAVGQSAVAAVFGIFSGFWLSFFFLVMAVVHNWFGFTTPAAGSTPASSIAVGAIEVFLITWLVIVVMLTLASLRLPSAFTAIFALIDLTLIFVLAGVSSGSSGDLKTAGVFTFAFVAVGVYLFFDAMSTATGGNALPLGRPVIKG
jgi:succinate-acetate transporter protein